MTVRESGALVSRGLAIYFLSISISSVIHAATYVFGVPQYAWSRIEEYMALAAIYFLFAGILWRKADRFASDLDGLPAQGGIDPAGLLRVVLAGIAVYWIFNEIEPLLNHLTSYLRGEYTSQYIAALVDHSVLLVAAIALFLYSSRGMTIGRMIAYPRAEPGDEN
ncbi:MAG: hypothetical protein ACHQ50_07555 [Fimbriimonadales bacterium]